MARDNISLVPAVRTVQTSKEGSLTNPISCDTPRDLACDVLDGVQIIQSLQTLPLLFNTEYLQLAQPAIWFPSPRPPAKHNTQFTADTQLRD